LSIFAYIDPNRSSRQSSPRTAKIKIHKAGRGEAAEVLDHLHKFGGEAHRGGHPQEGGANVMCPPSSKDTKRYSRDDAQEAISSRSCCPWDRPTTNSCSSLKKAKAPKHFEV
jgi:hypothetical protein